MELSIYMSNVLWTMFIALLIVLASLHETCVAVLPEDSRGCALDANTFERIRDCRAESCLSCVTVPATCTLVIAGNLSSSGSLHCSADVSGCSVVQCGNCETCSGAYVRSPVTGQYTHASICVALSSLSVCDNGTSNYDCVGEGVATAQHAQNIFYCNCHGENCTAKLTQRYSNGQPSPEVAVSPSATVSAKEPESENEIHSTQLHVSQSADGVVINGREPYYVITVVLGLLCITAAAVVVGIVLRGHPRPRSGLDDHERGKVAFST